MPRLQVIVLDQNPLRWFALPTVFLLFVACAAPAAAAPEPGNPELTWTNGAAYDGVIVERAPVVSGKCDAFTDVATLPGAAQSWTDTAPLPGHACYRVRAFYTVDLGAGPVPMVTGESNIDATKGGPPKSLQAR